MSPKLQKTIFILVFVALGFGLLQVPFTALVGANAHFTFFDFFGPIVGGFLSSLPAMLTVFAMQLVNWAWHGFRTDTLTLVRFLPMLFATLYFAKKSKWMLLVPAAAMIAFWSHPEGRQAWYFALYWLIPIAMHFLHDKFIFARALGTTFTAHAVGGALWIWVLNMKAPLWISLIPVVWKERGLMTIGMTLTYLAFNVLFKWLGNKGWIKTPFVTAEPKPVTP